MDHEKTNHDENSDLFEYTGHANAARNVQEVFEGDQTVSQVIGQAWDNQYTFDSETCDILHDVGKFFIPLNDDGTISDDFGRLATYLSGATLALEAIDRLCVELGMDLAEFREQWRAAGLVRVVDISRMENSTPKEKYESQSIAIIAKGHEYLGMASLEPYADMVSQIDDRYPEVALHSNIFKAAFGYVLGEAMRHMPLENATPLPELNDIDKELDALLGDGSWADTLAEACYDSTPENRVVDVTIECMRIQRLFDDLVEEMQVTELTHSIAQRITDRITDKITTDSSLAHAVIPDDSATTVKGAVYMLLFPVKHVDEGPREQVFVECLEPGDVLEGEFGNVASVTAHPPAEVEPHDWIHAREMVYGPAIVLKNPIQKSEDGDIKAIHDGKAVIISLDHPELLVSYKLD